MEQTLRDRGTKGSKEYDDGNQRDKRQLGSHRQVTHYAFIVAVSSVARQARHNCRQQGDTDDAIRHLNQQPRLLVNDRCLGVGKRTDAGSNDIAQLGNCHINDNRGGHATELLQARIHAPQRLQVYLRPPQIRHQDQALDDDTGGGTQAQ